MRARRYKSEDFGQIKYWGQQWGAEYNEDLFPTTGFIVDGIAAYFLYATDSSVCWLENLISARGIDEVQRQAAIDLLTDAILDEAKAMGFTVAYATTDNVHVMKQAKKNGARVTPGQVLLTKDLTNKIN